MSKFSRIYLIASSILMGVGALLHLAAIAIGADAYALLGAPSGLVAIVGTGSSRPVVSVVVIAGLLSFGAAYGASGAGLGPRLPARGLVLWFIAIALFTRGMLLPAAVAWQPHLVSGICGRCQSVNGFVLVTSALCIIVGGGFAAGARNGGSDENRFFRRTPVTELQ